MSAQTVEYVVGPEEQVAKPKFGFVRTTNVHNYDFYLYSDIGDAENYTEMIHTIRNAEPYDNVIIHLNTGGGNLDTGIAIISAINESQATVTTVLDSSAYSMGAIIFLAGHQHIVHNCSMIMFHTFSGGFVGKSNDIDRQVQAHKRQYSMLIKQVCSKFLSVDEINRLDNGEELWFASDIVEKRLKAIVKAQTAETIKTKQTK